MFRLFLILLGISSAFAAYTSAKCRTTCQEFGEYLGKQGYYDQLNPNTSEAIKWATEFCKKKGIIDAECESITASAKQIYDYSRAGQSIVRICNNILVCPKVSVTGAKIQPKSQKWRLLQSKFRSLLGIFAPVKRIVMNILGKVEEKVSYSDLLPEEPDYCRTCKQTKAQLEKPLTASNKERIIKMAIVICSKMIPRTFCTEKTMGKLLQLVIMTAKNQPMICKEIGACSNISFLRKTSTSKISLHKQFCSGCTYLQFKNDKKNSGQIKVGKFLDKIMSECGRKGSQCGISLSLIQVQTVRTGIGYSVRSFLEELEKKSCEKLLQCDVPFAGNDKPESNFFCNLCRKAAQHRAQNQSRYDMSSRLANFCTNGKSFTQRAECLNRLKQTRRILERGSQSLPIMCENVFCNRDSIVRQKLQRMTTRLPSHGICEMCKNGMKLLTNKQALSTLKGQVNQMCHTVTNDKCLNETIQLDQIMKKVFAGEKADHFCGKLSFCSQQSDNFLNSLLRKVQGIFMKIKTREDFA